MKSKKFFLAISFLAFASCASKPSPVVSDTVAKNQSALLPLITSTSVIQSPEADLIEIPEPEPPQFEGAPQIRAMAFDDSHNLWIATQTDLIKLNTNSGRYSRYNYDELLDAQSTEDSIKSLAVDPEGSVLVMTYFGRVKKFQNGIWLPVIDVKTYITGGGLERQKDGSVRIELGYLGAYKYDGKSLKHIQVPKQFSCGFSSVLEGNEEIWAIDGQCMKLPPELRKYNNGDWIQIEGYSPTKLFKDIKGNIWFWDDKYGLIRADLSEVIGLPAKLYFSYTVDVAFAPDNSIWFMDYRYGVFRFTKEKWEYINLDFATNRLSCLVVAPNGSIYLGTNKQGLLHLENSQWTQTLFIQ